MVDVCRYLVPKLCNVVGYGIFLTINVIITIVYGIRIVDYGLPQLLMHMFIHFLVSAQLLMVSTKFINFNKNVV
jgi:aspartyl aminopeptidase